MIATWRRPDALRRCLAAVDAQDHAAAEVVVAVRADDGATWAQLGSCSLESSTLRTVRVEAPGVVTAMNAGIDAAAGDVIAFTDDDAAPRTDWLARIHAHLEQSADVGGVGGRDWVHSGAEVKDGAEPVVGWLAAYGRHIGNHHLGAGGPREVDVLKGVNMAFRRGALEGRRLDPRLRGSGAQVHWELALCLAAKRAGWKLLYDPAVAVDHYPAERFDQDGRTDTPSLPALADEVHNETYALLRWLPWWRKAAALAYGVGVGSRRAPGLVTAAEQWLRDGDRAALGARLVACERARLAGLRTSVRARRPGRAG